MKGQIRRSWRKIERKFSDARSTTVNFFRSNSSYQERPITSPPLTRSISESDTDDDPVFESVDVRPPTPQSAEAEAVSRTSLPCEFCNEQIADNELWTHQASCQERPRLLQVNHHGSASRRTASDSSNRPRRSRRLAPSAPSAPTAPVRERSPSPTEGFPIQNNLRCPITLALFVDPVVANDGHTYEREAITRIIRQSGVSPMTREPLRLDKLNDNRVVKTMVDEFRAECKRKRELYKYRIDVDLKKGEEITSISTAEKKVFLIEWSKPQQPIHVVLLHLTGENAATLATVLCRIPLHPNLVRTHGRVENSANEILIVQEYLPVQTLAELLAKHEQIVTLPLLDMIFLQIACALGHLKESNIVFGDLTANDVLIYQLNNFIEQNHIKLTNVSNYLISPETSPTDRLAPEVQTNRTFSSQSDVFTFGMLARQCYSPRLIFPEHQELFERCIAADAEKRPTIEEIIETFKQWTED